MKTLFLLRHAKSSRDDPTLRDFDRPLNDRGKDDAKRIGRYLRQQRVSFEVIVSSPAKRARRTSELIVKAAEAPPEPVFDERIYEATAHQLLRVVSEINSAHQTVLLVGHNPGFEDLLTSLTDRAARMPTASLACINLSVEKWKDIAPRSGELLWLITPKDLKT